MFVSRRRNTYYQQHLSEKGKPRNKFEAWRFNLLAVLMPGRTAATTSPGSFSPSRQETRPPAGRTRGRRDNESRNYAPPRVRPLLVIRTPIAKIDPIQQITEKPRETDTTVCTVRPNFNSLAATQPKIAHKQRGLARGP